VDNRNDNGRAEIGADKGSCRFVLRVKVGGPADPDVDRQIVNLSLGPSNSIGVRIGGHIGPVVVSRFGHSSHQQITAAGDTVNVASRLMTA
jgi:hypothetical protein